MRVRGLKYDDRRKRFRGNRVAPHAGAWIEMFGYRNGMKLSTVAPHAGAWIEIRHSTQSSQQDAVAPHAGAWIEIDNEGAYDNF